MNVGSRRLAYRRLRAPRDDRGVLIDPPWSEIPRLIASNEAPRAARDYDMQGRSLAALADQAREQLLHAARHYTRQYRSTDAPSRASRLLLAGHQPELFHPGVWFKNFALGALAREQSAVAINLVIDSDTIKDVSLRVPGGSIDAPQVEAIPFDESSSEIPFEEREIEDRRAFASFGARAAAALRPIVSDPLLEQFWPRVLQRAEQTANLGQCFSQARHVLEGEWGLDTLELPQSQVCELEAFHWFTAHLLAHLPRFRDIYNEAIETYRRVHRIRSANHPAPNLATQDDWLEAPFWLWCPGAPRRRRMFVRRHASGLSITDRRKIEFELPLDLDGDAARAVEVLASLASRGIKLRSRALVTTLFARLVLSDLFVHGIGGAKYDQLTDQLFERFFSLEPPRRRRRRRR